MIRPDIWSRKNEVLKLYIKNNFGITPIAKLMNCDFCVIKRVLQNENLEIRPISFYLTGKQSKKRIIKDEKEILNMYTNKNISGRKIAKFFSCDCSVIYDILNKYNIPLKRAQFLIGKSSPQKGKTLEEIHGKEKALNILNKLKKPKRKLKGHKNFNRKFLSCFVLGHKLNKESIDKIREARAKQIMPMKDTKIEVKIQNFLSALHLEYVAHKYMSEISHKYQCDIYLPKQIIINENGILEIKQNTIIECDGDAFHFNPKFYKKEDKIFKNGMTAEERWKLDNIRTRELQEAGYKVIRFWECDIKKMELNNFKGKLNES